MHFQRKKVMALIAVWAPEKPNECYGCTLPGLPGTNSAGNSLEECIVNIQEAFDLMTEENPLQQADLASLVDTSPMLVHEDDTMTTCWWRVILLEANVANDVVLDVDYLAMRDSFRDIKAEIEQALSETKQN